MTERCGFEEIEHTADWALHVWAEDFGQLCACAARGMLSLVGVDAQPSGGRWRLIDLRADDRETLLVVWLEEVLFALETEQVTITAFDLQIEDGRRLVGRLRSAPTKRPGKPIKAITFHNLSIVETEAGMETTLVFDV